MRRALAILLPLAIVVIVLMNAVTPFTTAVGTGAGQATSTTMPPAATLFSEASELKKRGPIMIYGDWGFTRENGVVAGSGTADDPYIIEGWEIDASGHSYGIYIWSTRAYFIIRNCKIYGASQAGISLVNVANGKIIGNNIIGNGNGILLWDSSNNIIEYNNVMANDYGIYLESSSNNTIAGNNFINNHVQVYSSFSTNT